MIENWQLIIQKSLKRPAQITLKILPPINICSHKRNHMTGTFLISLLIDDEYQHFKKCHLKIIVSGFNRNWRLFDNGYE